MEPLLALPDGYTARPATTQDAEAVTELVAACERHDLGEALIELEDVVADWQRPSFDLATGSMLICDTDGLVAYGEVARGRRAEVGVHPAHRGRGLGTALMRWSWATARGQGGSLVGQTVPESPSDAVDLLTRHGYRPIWTSWVLELPDGKQLPEAALPAGVEIRERVGENDDRAAYRVIENAFNEWPDREPTSYEDWAAGVVERPGFEPWQLLLAVAGDDIVGACHLQVSGGFGWVNQLAVRRDQRGRGLGRALLTYAFGRARAHGAKRAELSTDSRTGALGLYESVGMRVKQSFVHLAKEL